MPGAPGLSRVALPTPGAAPTTPSVSATRTTTAERDLMAPPGRRVRSWQAAPSCQRGTKGTGPVIWASRRHDLADPVDHLLLPFADPLRAYPHETALLRGLGGRLRDVDEPGAEG